MVLHLSQYLQAEGTFPTKRYAKGNQGCTCFADRAFSIEMAIEIVDGKDKPEK